MKKIIIYIAVLVLGLSALTGCKRQADDTTEHSQEESEETYVSLTDEEMNLLCNKYVDEDRIKEGHLYPYQLEALEQFRFGKNYIETKYPEVSFQYFHLTAIKESTNETGELQFYVPENGDDETFSIEIRNNGSTYEATDNYTAIYYNSLYAEYASDLLKQTIPYNYRVYSIVNGFFDANQDSTMPAGDVFSLENKKDIFIYIDAEPDEEKAKSIVADVENFFRTHNQYISCGIYFAEGVLEQNTLIDCREYVHNSVNSSSHSFNTFD